MTPVDPVAPYSEDEAPDASNYEYPYDDEFGDDEDDDGLFDCGMGPDGQCSKAGSEECDWDCPYGT